jgi:hypothetical protein
VKKYAVEQARRPSEEVQRAMSRLCFLLAGRGRAANHLECSIRTRVDLEIARPLGRLYSDMEPHAFRGRFEPLLIKKP